MDLDFETVKRAVEQGKSIRAAARLLNKSYTSLQWWLLKNRCHVVTSKSATLVCEDKQR